MQSADKGFRNNGFAARPLNAGLGVAWLVPKISAVMEIKNKLVLVEEIA
jgi:hypothetical protein